MVQAHAFVSYVRENQNDVDRLATALRALGLNVWLDRESIAPGQYWKDAISQAIGNGAYFLACYSKEFNERLERYMHGELRLAIDRLRQMPRSRVWYIPVMINETYIPNHKVSDSENLSDIQIIKLNEDWNLGIFKILQAMNLEDASFRRAMTLIDLIRYNPEERIYGIQQLKSFGSIPQFAARLLPVLVEILDDPQPAVRRDALNLFATLGAEAGAVAERIARQLFDPVREVRWTAASTLSSIGPAARTAVSCLVEASENDSDRSVRELARQALHIVRGDLYTGDIHVMTIPLLKKLFLEEKDGQLRAQLIYNLQIENIDNDGAFDILVTAASDPVSRVRKAVAKKIASLNIHSEPAVSVVRKLYRDSNAGVRRAAHEAGKKYSSV